VWALLLPLAVRAQAWPTSTPERQGLAAAPLQQFTERARAGDFGNLDRIVVVRNGTLVWNERFDRDYQTISRGKTSPIGCGFASCTSPADSNEFNYLHPAWHPWYQGRRVHTLQSVTKSVTSALIGIAISRNEIRSVEEPLLSFFGDYDLSRVDSRLRKATLADLLTMRSGIEWHEQDRPLDETNTTIQLEKSPDWIRFTLAQPMDADPGTKWAYNSGGSQLMSQIIRATTGMHVDEYARRHLFEPVGIRDFHWKKTPTGHPDTEGGLYLEAEDLARIGWLYLNGGTWNGRRILPQQWITASTTKHVENVNGAGFGYGYQWWRADRAGVEVWAGLGFGGQFLVVLPQQRIVGVINSWNVYGGRNASPLGPFVDALIAAAR
jgi:CubicO group peptidase (beta-lactamase class C family)